MININNTLIAGGYYHGGLQWKKEASNLDNCFKLYYMEKGEARLVSAEKEYRLVEDNVYFINGYRMKKQYSPVSFRVYWLHFISDSVLLKQALYYLPLVTKLDTTASNINLADFAVLEEYFKIDPNQKKRINTSMMAAYFKIQAVLLNILSTLAVNSHPDTFHTAGYGGRLFRAIQFMNVNYKNVVTLKQLAEMCYVSENYFHSLFKKEYTVTPNNYLLQLRMNEALNLLSSTNLSIKEVAQECGYHDAAYFSRTFSKYFSLSPNKYRNLNNTRIP